MRAADVMALKAYINALHMTAVTQLLPYWSYDILALNRQYIDVTENEKYKLGIVVQGKLDP